MKDLVSQLEENESSSFSVGELDINYPGYKGVGDYRLTINGVAPKHTDIVEEVYESTNRENIEEVIAFLDDVYTNGLNATSEIFSNEFSEKIYWITLQEEMNYPQPRYRGRKLPFQRFYEGALSKVSNLDIKRVKSRTNNHGSGVPQLLNINNYPIPSFYN